MSELVDIARADMRPCQRCGGQLSMGVMGVFEMKSFLIDPASARAVAGLEVHFGPGHEALASMMSPGIKGTPGMTERKILCFGCIVHVMEASALPPTPKEDEE